MRHNVHIACADCDQSAWRLSPKSDAGIHEAATAMSGAAQVGECRARALESGALDSWLSRERLLCGCAVKRRRFPVGESPTRQNAPAGCNRSNCGGNET